MKNRIARIGLVVVASLGLLALGTAQLQQVIKILGVGAAVRQFGPEMNRAMNRMVRHSDTEDSFTKVVPIITIGLNTRGAIGAAQVKGSRRNVERVQAVAAPEAQFLGREVMLRGLIPVSEANPDRLDELKAVNGVGVSGIVDIRL
ncbi:MAG: hypothetical protein MH204_04020 [Fimbriimonadaceae bacterium]|nr:hypothetical protein [Fimbriimonadaceae bacterium]